MIDLIYDLLILLNNSQFLFILIIFNLFFNKALWSFRSFICFLRIKLLWFCGSILFNFRLKYDGILDLQFFLWLLKLKIEIMQNLLFILILMIYFFLFSFHRAFMSFFLVYRFDFLLLFWYLNLLIFLFLSVLFQFIVIFIIVVFLIRVSSFFIYFWLHQGRLNQ